jgi:arabinose-5-phosphate isomerase
MDFISCAKDVFDCEINALIQTKEILGSIFEDIVRLLIGCEGKIVLCGMGKSGHIARKMSATFASLGSPSFFLHPAEALHGDLGMISSNDVVILISNSGENQEMLHMLPSIKLIGAKLVAITAEKNSTLAGECDYIQVMPKVKEACALNLAPTSSTTAVLVYGDALAVAMSMYQGFTKKDFALFHPDGVLGKKILIRVKDIMVTGEEMPIVTVGCKISDAIIEMSKKGLGVVTITDKQGYLAGILTDGDLRRAIEKKTDMYGDIVNSIMTKNPQWIKEDILAVEALYMLKNNSLNNYPVVDNDKKVIGVITWQMIVKNGIVV